MNGNIARTLYHITIEHFARNAPQGSKPVSVEEVDFSAHDEYVRALATLDAHYGLVLCTASHYRGCDPAEGGLVIVTTEVYR